ncbi:surfeit locus protein 1 [Neocloeon triangulifer]|uniref:surfeit locus protein 1 n=1 Tax=Neocloeon triangulifer TaxID=2078957 RepID=UPI00286FAADF|nr:surfeit locus protein 1 [Neocloeon triangulifer]XP_059474088.1 surfeit locus protein 1 [Neocloeon triangulifer]
MNSLRLFSEAIIKNNAKTQSARQTVLTLSLACRCSNVTLKRFVSTRTIPANKEGEKVTPLGWFLLLMPVTAFGLGSWQVKRRAWKLQLIEDLSKRTMSKPVELPQSMDKIEELEYCPVTVRGTFDHSKEVFIGPRSLLTTEETSSALMPGKSGVLVVTPFKLADRDETILVQRGWIPSNLKNSTKRLQGQVEGEVTLTGVVRLNEQRGAFIPKSQPTAKMFYFRDMETMARELGTDPIFLDALASSTVPGGPIGGQTRVSLRNEHFSYILTWYSLSAFTGYMWYRNVLKKVPLL